jgi:hypothetical protein
MRILLLLLLLPCFVLGQQKSSKVQGRIDSLNKVVMNNLIRVNMADEMIDSLLNMRTFNDTMLYAHVYNMRVDFLIKIWGQSEKIRDLKLILGDKDGARVMEKAIKQVLDLLDTGKARMKLVFKDE